VTALLVSAMEGRMKKLKNEKELLKKAIHFGMNYAQKKRRG